MLQTLGEFHPVPYCCPSLPLSVSFGVAWSLSMSIGSYAQGLSGSGSVDLVVCSCSVPALPCLSAFRPLYCFLDLPWFWLSGSHGIIPTRMFMCFWLASCELVARFVMNCAFYVHICTMKH
jgi:hypothetical protein